jgi:hypothetical protein
MSKTGRHTLHALLVGLTLLVPACGAETAALPLIILTNTWREEGNEDHTFQFNDDTDGVPRNAGTFTGVERLDDGVTEYAFDGSWNDGHITFTVDRPTDVTYSASFSTDNPDRLVFSSSAGNLVLIRN